jgi:hypothetical protein
MKIIVVTTAAISLLPAAAFILTDLYLTIEDYFKK